MSTSENSNNEKKLIQQMGKKQFYSFILLSPSLILNTATSKVQTFEKSHNDGEASKKNTPSLCTSDEIHNNFKDYI